MKQKFYHWLPIIFGCHCREDRSFHWKGEKFPICARCTGELIGIILGLVSSFFFRISVECAIIIMIPMILDGLIQLKTSYRSTNIKRLITGGMFGYAFSMLFVISTLAAFWYGVNLAK